MFGWLKTFALVQRHKLISQNNLALQTMMKYHFRKKNFTTVDLMQSLEDQNTRIAVEFYHNKKLAPPDDKKLKILHRKIRSIFREAYPTKNFNRTFGPSGVRDPEIEND